MKLLASAETLLEGKWIFDGKVMSGDEACNRIEFLVSNVLTKVAISEKYGAWETLYQDPADGRFWEKTYPQNEMHGGGPPTLRAIAVDEAKSKYAIK